MRGFGLLVKVQFNSFDLNFINRRIRSYNFALSISLMQINTISAENVPTVSLTGYCLKKYVLGVLNIMKLEDSVLISWVNK